ncbi:ABC transporter permease [Methanococcoides sp. NM1]|uniref:ABC transporter permease n=1 Tax=Methanococcoides sp. NM1 TaxID=1201013 RepID=UPI001083CD2D|nr:ABC transporter permease [Methanococcoides sp. NM1]
MSYELFIAVRHIKSKRRQTLLSIIAIAIAVMVLSVSQAIMVGFTDELYDKTIDQLPHVTISPEEDEEYIHLHNNVLKDILNIEGVVAASPYLIGTATFSNDELSRNAILKGIDPAEEDAVSYLSDDIVEGDLFGLVYSRKSIILGDEFAEELEVVLGDTIDVSFPNAKTISLKVVGIYDTGTPYDTSLAYTSLQTSQEFFDTTDVINGMSLRIEDIHQDMVIAEMIKQKGYNAQGWTETNPEILRTMAIETAENYIIYGLLLLIASFGVVSTLNMMVMGKMREIGIMMAMGVSPSSIRTIFLLESGLLGLTGAILGASAGIIISSMIGDIEIGGMGDTYGFTSIPVIVRATDVLLVVIGVFILNIVAGLYPARKAASFDPVYAISNR